MAEENDDDVWSDEEDYLDLDLDFGLDVAAMRRHIDDGAFDEPEDENDDYEVDEGVFAAACGGAAKALEESTARDWVPMPKNINRPDRIHKLFDGASTGIPESIGVSNKTSLVNMFRLFFSMEFLTRIVQATNEYARTEREAEAGNHKGKWTPIDVPTLTKFLGLTFLMGIIRKARLKDYWNRAPEIFTPYFPEVMTRDRFIAILRYINFPYDPPAAPPPAADDPPAAAAAQDPAVAARDPAAAARDPADAARDPAANPAPNPTHKVSAKSRVSWLFDYFNRVSRMVYKPSRELAIDESMCAHKGRSEHVQYMPAKPVQWGLKVWALAESATGYFLSAFPFFSRRKNGQKPFTIYEDVVLRLLKASAALGKGHHVYTDNYYTCVPMVEELATKFQTYSCGTVRATRKYLPEVLKGKKIPKVEETGDCEFQFSRNMVMVAWQDNKLVRVLSSIHGSSMTMCKRNGKRSKKDGQFQGKVDVACPVMVRDYTAYMGAVDRGDQMYQYYSFGRKTRKWTKKLFWYLLELMKLNSHIMYNSLQPKKVNLHDFTISLATQLIAQATVAEAIPPMIPPPPKEARLVRRCFPSRMDTKILCRVCRDRVQAGTIDRPHTSSFGCKTCQVSLCVDPCFMLFHVKQNYATWRGDGPARPAIVEIPPPAVAAIAPQAAAVVEPALADEAAEMEPQAPDAQAGVPMEAAQQPDVDMPDILPPKRRRKSKTKPSM